MHLTNILNQLQASENQKLAALKYFEKRPISIDAVEKFLDKNVFMNSYSNGKLLLTSEYAALGGAKALALPCRKGKILNLKNSTRILSWKSYDNKNFCGLK